MARKIDTDANIAKIRVAEQGSDPSAPATGFGWLYEKTDQQLYLGNASGTASNLYHYGTSFPGSPKTSELFYRTDRNLMYFYDGTRWLTTNEYPLHLAILDALQGTNTAPSIGGPVDHSVNGAYVTRYVSWTYVSTGSGSAYVTYQLRTRAPDGTAHNLGSSFNTSADTPAQFTLHTGTIGAVVTSGDSQYNVVGTKTSTPTGLYCDMTVYYRLIG